MRSLAAQPVDEWSARARPQAAVVYKYETKAGLGLIAANLVALGVFWWFLSRTILFELAAEGKTQKRTFYISFGLGYT
jgi:hypothetical protein